MTVDLDRQLREYCRGLDEKQGALSLEDILEWNGDRQIVPGRGDHRPSPRRRWVAAALVILITAIGVRLLENVDGILQPADQPTMTSTTTRSTLASSADSSPHALVRGWPDTNSNAAGLYSWNGSSCAGASCTQGFMHNGFGSGDVDITFAVLPDGSISNFGATEVTVAGYNGIHRQIDALREEWLVDIEGRVIAITLIVEPDTAQADLAEAYAIIDSIRTEPMDNYLGFRLVFELSTNDWDSG